MAASAPSQRPETTLVIRHIAKSDPTAFEVMRLADGKASPPAKVVSPVGFPVEGRPNSDLLQELQWYLEDFLDYPFPLETDHAERVQKALRDWGEKAFNALFADVNARRMFDTAVAKGRAELHLRIASDDPRILAWPWEALRDPELGVLAQTCQVQRRLDTAPDAKELPETLQKDRVNILLVVARPFDHDVRFRSIARPLVELIEHQKLPATVELLRPPTFDRLREHLLERRGHYHILHFDGHGAYEAEAPGGDKYALSSELEGKLAFETEDGKPDLISAEKLSTLLEECAVPGVVLNACQSAMVKGESRDPFSSVAMALLRSGMRDVVAMAYSLYVSGAQQFLPAFYRRLFESGSMAVAVRAGRQQMWQHDKRVCVRGEFPLEDWLLPVLYQQEPLDLSFAKQAGESTPRRSLLPDELRRERDRFVGRDSAILAIERAMRRDPAGILIHGLGGVGKTTLARGFLQWLDQTGGLKYRPMWFSFQEIRSAEYVFNRMGEVVFGETFSALAAETPEKTMRNKLELIARALRENPLLLVWDNFESASGIPGTATTANVTESDRSLLAQFLMELRGGATKVIITSRSPEDWLGPQRRFLLRLGGLDHEERWEYCNAILRDLGQSINREDQELAELMNLLGGHPLAMRSVLPQLEKLSASQVLAALRSNLGSLKLEGDEGQRKLYATLAFVERSLPDELRPLMTLVGMHEGFLSVDLLERMAKEVDAKWSREEISALMQALVSAGLLRAIVYDTYQMHPLLTSYLRSGQTRNAADASWDAWARAFVHVMGGLADVLAPRALHEQRVLFQFHGQSFYEALAQAERLQMPDELAALAQSLAAFAQNSRNFEVAKGLFKRSAEQRKASGCAEDAAAAYHQLGIIAQEQRDFAAAERLYRESLAIREPGDELGAAKTYHQLGRLAEELRDLETAEGWYRKSLAIKEKNGDDHGLAITYNQLGILAAERGDWVSADSSFHQALAIFERLGSEVNAGKVCHQLGRVAQHRRNFVVAAGWYQRSLDIKEKHGDEYGAANTFHQLGNIAYMQRDFHAAEQWYRRSLSINEKMGDEHEASDTYYQLGLVAEGQKDFTTAEQWCRKALAIQVREGNAHAAGMTYMQLGIVAGLRLDFIQSGEWLIKSITTFLSLSEENFATRCVRNFIMVTYKQAGSRDQIKLKAMWQDAGLGDLPEVPDDPKS
jgi:tetratricopeptide (TPR) repeat protein